MNNLSIPLLICTFIDHNYNCRNYSFHSSFDQLFLCAWILTRKVKHTCTFCEQSEEIYGITECWVASNALRSIIVFDMAEDPGAAPAPCAVFAALPPFWLCASAYTEIPWLTTPTPISKALMSFFKSFPGKRKFCKLVLIPISISSLYKFF